MLIYKGIHIVAVALVVLATLGCGGGDATPSSAAGPGQSGMTQTIRQGGVAITLPPKWASRASEGSSERVGVIQGANFSLPATDNGVGERAQEAMQQDDILIAVADYGPAASWTQPPRWEQTSLPVLITRSDFQLLEGFPAPAEAKRSVVVNERAITVYVAFGREDPTPEQIAEANEVLSSLTVE